jgi:hypothetical protein
VYSFFVYSFTLSFALGTVASAAGEAAAAAGAAERVLAVCK